ncbi:hypothetical protein Tco_0801339 [Tanacetum coccineum]|uniref:Uncharacterized protein n=1 Tax=Tanacetum coccineum TaxID=301880 RepID=A0ABQ4ZYK5_9ASTR
MSLNIRVYYFVSDWELLRNVPFNQNKHGKTNFCPTVERMVCKPEGTVAVGLSNPVQLGTLSEAKHNIADVLRCYKEGVRAQEEECK